ncbi:hypothetical protein E2C01_090930 [Portunus trituberculatus]|uniref:Uncharacterized protein n=1 Tax=Portunus trituberculatus TaxID=210409 RepID=A0A5B7JN22_PORTR|nr:hypothetical protein [Portunus trituberculatus]
MTTAPPPCWVVQRRGRVWSHGHACKVQCR